ncbi:MAG: alpha/beta hydrolase [Gemmatimonadaceae bacterium]|nr:alpha/beta hydrolase [Gemmatimonadaceae bacterium]
MSHIAQASVVTGSTTTHYQVAGTGPPVVLLLPEHLRLGVLDQLRSRFRVLAPSLESPAMVAEFADGLGLESPILVVDSTHSDDARSALDQQPGRFSRVVVLPADGVIDAGTILPDARGTVGPGH